MPEGRLYFHHEPVLEVTAPIIEAQIIETLVINQVNLQSLIATKAARCTWAAQGKTLVDFSLRRAHGTDAGMKAARSSHIAGFASTSNVLAGRTYGLPIAGTMAHSFVTSFEREIDAFRAYAESFPDDTVLLIDTYDTVAAARKAATVGREMEEQGHRLRAVRLDSGDLLQLSREVRRILDDAGLGYVRILASGGLDEYSVDSLVRGGAPIDAIRRGHSHGGLRRRSVAGCGLQAGALRRPPCPQAERGKGVPAGREAGVPPARGSTAVSEAMYLHLLTRRRPAPDAEPLLHTVMERGEPTSEPPPLSVLRERFRDEFAALDDHYKRLSRPIHYPVRLSNGLQLLRHELSSQPESNL